MRILIPTDFSENAYKAIEYVYTHFKTDHLYITLVHTVTQPKSSAGVILRLEDLMKKDAEENMQQLVQQIKTDFNDEPDTIVRNGYLNDWLKTIVRDLQLDLIVMGTKGESNMASKLLGSITETVIRTSPTPVMAIPNLPFKERVHEFVIATKETELSHQEFISDMINSLKLENPRLHVLTIASKEDTTVLPRMISVGPFQFGTVCHENENTVDGINDYLDKNKVDVLCFYHKKNSRLNYIMNQSITKTICSKTPVPLLIIPAHN